MRPPSPTAADEPTLATVVSAGPNPYPLDMTEGDSVAEIAVGQEFAGYLVERLLGRGGMSVVYLAEDQALGRRVALKVLAPKLSVDRRFRERFRLESRLAASIDHPNVIPIYEAGEAEGRLYIAMRYVDGTDMRSLLDKAGALEPRRAVELTSQVADGLEAAHARGLVHRDVKPSNVLIASQGEREHVYLADFGLTKTEGEADDDDATPRLSGTVDYVAPEQITEGTGGASADVYALGCVLYEALTGQVPYPRSSELETLWAHVDDAPPAPSKTRPNLPRALDDVVASALAKDPAERYATPSQLAGAARAALPMTTRFSGRIVLALALALIALVAAALVTAIVLVTDGEESSTAPTVDLTGGALQRVDLDGTRLSATYELAGEPVDVALSGNGVIVADAATDTLYRIDVETGSVAPSRVTGSGSSNLAAGPAGLWLAGYGLNGEGVLHRLTSGPGTVSAVATVDVRELSIGSTGPPPPVNAVAALEADPNAGVQFAGWVLDAAEGSLLEVRPQTSGYSLTRLETGGTPLVLDAAGVTTAFSPNEPLAYPAGVALWVAQEDELLEYSSSPDEATRIASRTRVEGTPVAVAASETGAWVATREGVLARVAGGRVAASVQAPGRPVDLALGEGALWLLTSDGTLHRLDPQSGSREDSEDVGANPVALAVGRGAVWVAARGGDADLPARVEDTFEAYASASIRVPGSCGAAGALPSRCYVSGRVQMRSADGTEAVYEGAWLERNNPAGGPVECEEGTVEAPFASTVHDAGAARLRIDRLGTLALRFEEMAVARSAAAPGVGVICGKGTGVWHGIAGPVTGEQGRFTWYGPENERIVFESS